MIEYAESNCLPENEKELKINHTLIIHFNEEIYIDNNNFAGIDGR